MDIRPPERHQQLFAGMICLLLLVALSGCASREAVLVLQDIGAGSEPSRLKVSTAEPSRTSVAYTVDGRAGSGDLYLPGDGMSQAGIVLVPGVPAHVEALVGNLMTALLVFFVVMAISAALSALEDLYRETPRGQQRSIKGMVQLVKLGLFVVAGLVIIAAVTGKHIGLLLSVRGKSRCHRHE